MKTPEEAEKLARLMVKIGRQAGKRTEALITNMDIPLGRAVGNAMEVREAVEVLKGEGPEDLREICLLLSSRMIALAGVVPEGSARTAAEQALDSGAALDCFAAMVKAQHGDPEQILHPEQLPFAAIRHEVKATKSGYVHHMDTEVIGLPSKLLGAGRAKKEDSLDYGAGIYLRKKTGEAVEAGETLAVFYTSDGSRIPAAETRFLESVFIRPEAPEPEPLVYGHVS